MQPSSAHIAVRTQQCSPEKAVPAKSRGEAAACAIAEASCFSGNTLAAPAKPGCLYLAHHFARCLRTYFSMAGRCTGKVEH
eukprot:12001-Heterococcus_DN1.PRE.1